MTSTTTPWVAISSEPHELGEGLRLVDDVFRWVDLLRGRSYLWDPADTAPPELALEIDRPLGVVERGPDGHLLAVCGTGLSRVEYGVETSGVTTLTELADTGLDPARHRVNDGSFAPDGSFWFGTMVHDGSTPEGTLWRWDSGTGSLEAVLTDIDIPNGPVFLPDGASALVADTSAGRILRTSVRSPRSFELFAEVAGGSPDGLHVDGEGRIWNAVWGASRIDVYRPDGSLDTSFPVPVSQPTSVIVGPGEGLQVIVTSASVGLSSPGALDGHTITADLALPSS